MTCRSSTPVENYLREYGLWVKREDLASPPPGPPFSKMRGVMAHIKNRPEQTIGVLDTYHSQAGWAVAAACRKFKRRCINFYPEYSKEPGPRHSQEMARLLGAKLQPLPAGRSAILFYQARRWLQEHTDEGYLMPNALKLPESVSETALEVAVTSWPSKANVILVPCSSATIAAGVLKGLAAQNRWRKGVSPTLICHLGYSRSHAQVHQYVREMVAPLAFEYKLVIIDEAYDYKDRARSGKTPPWPCNEYYDLKAFRWWLREGRKQYNQALFWNIG